MKPEDFLLRPVAEADLPALERIAAASADGISSLPHDRAKLQSRIQHSLQSFASQDQASGEESYLFVLVDLAAGRIIGTSGVVASAGFHDRFYSYRNEYVVQSAPRLGVSQRVHTLHLCHDLTGCTLLSSFYIEPEYGQTLAPQLLSRARLLFILQQAERFSDRIVAENPGLSDEAGHSPFWDAIGRRFFSMDYPQAERVSGGRAKAFIADLMPQSPIYVPLLPESAQWAIGQLHPVGELPFSILQDEGFETDTYVDIFDGGPTVDARLGMLRTVRAARRVPLVADANQAGEADEAAWPSAGVWHLVGAQAPLGFSACLASLPLHQSTCPADGVLAARLQAQAGAPLIVAPLWPAETA